MLLRKSSIVRLKTTYKIMMLLSISNEFSSFVNKDKTILLILVDCINDAIHDCIEMSLCVTEIKRGLKSANILKMCNNIMNILDLMKKRLIFIKDNITANTKISYIDNTLYLPKELEYNIKMLYRYISEEAESNAEWN